MKSEPEPLSVSCHPFGLEIRMSDGTTEYLSFNESETPVYIVQTQKEN